MTKGPSNPPSPPRICHIALSPTFQGYGFNLHTMKGRVGQYVGKVDPGSPAEIAGLKEGDRLLEVNSADITVETHTQVVTRIKMVPGQTTLLVVDREAEDWYKEHSIVVTSSLPEVVIGFSVQPEEPYASSDSDEDDASDSDGEKTQKEEVVEEKPKATKSFEEELKMTTAKIRNEQESKEDLPSLKEELDENVDSGTEDSPPVDEGEEEKEMKVTAHDKFDGKPQDEAIERSTPEPEGASSSASDSSSITSEVANDSPKPVQHVAPVSSTESPTSVKSVEEVASTDSPKSVRSIDSASKDYLISVRTSTSIPEDSPKSVRSIDSASKDYLISVRTANSTSEDSPKSVKSVNSTAKDSPKSVRSVRSVAKDYPKSARSVDAVDSTNAQLKEVEKKPERKESTGWDWGAKTSSSKQDEVVPKSSPTPTPSPRTPPTAPSDGLDLPTSVAEMRRILQSRKRRDPRLDTMDARRKYDIVQGL